jgi:two-component system cell cycle sensor histidine kinase/response regulator CckA
MQMKRDDRKRFIQTAGEQRKRSVRPNSEKVGGHRTGSKTKMGEPLSNRTFTRDLADSLGMPVAVLDGKGRIRLVNEAWRLAAHETRGRGLLGAEEGMNFLEFCSHAGDEGLVIADEMVSGIKAVLERRRRIHSLEYSLHSRGEECWYHLQVTRLLGKRHGAVVVYEDVTALKRVEGSLRNILESSVSISIVSTDLNGKILFWNKGAENLLGYSAKEVVGHMNMDVFYPDHETRTIIQQIRQTIELERRPVSRELAERRKDGQLIWMHLTVSPRLDHQGNVIGMLGIGQDISDRISAERAGEEAEKEIRLLAQTVACARDAVCLTDLEGTILFVNEAFLHAHGFEEEDLLGQAIVTVYSARLPAEETAWTISPTITEGWHGEVLHRRKDGSEFPVELWTSMVKNDVGEAVAVVGVLRDITERKHAEMALRESEELFRTLVESSPVAMVISSDVEGKILYINPKFTSLFGYTLEDIPDVDHWWPLAYPEEEYRKRIATEWGRHIKLAIKSNSEIQPIETRVRCKDGNTKYIELAQSSLGERNIVFFTDLTLHRQAEEAVRISEEKYRSLYEESKDVVYISLPEGNLVDINPAGLELFGYASKEEILQVKIDRDLYADSRQREQLQRLMEEEGFVKDFEEVLVRKDGGRINILETATAVRDDRGRPVLYRGIMRDVTKQRQLEQVLSHAQKMESIGTLASGIAHDFNNILAIILGHAALLGRFKLEQDKFAQSVDAVTQAGLRGASLVKQLLTLARKTEPILESVHVNDIIAEISRLMHETFPRMIVISTDLQEDLPPITADATQIHQVLLNLCVNARDAMPRGGTLSIATKTVPGKWLASRYPNADERQYVEMRVSDTGTGMDESIRRRIFEPFFSTKGIGKGTGLGLALVYGIVTGHKGFVDVASKPGEGTVFRVYCPVEERMPESCEPSLRITQDTPGGTEVILLIEDEELLREFLSIALVSKGYTVLKAQDGEEGLQTFIAHQHEIGVVVSDMGLPDFSGEEVFRRIRAIDPGAKVILASGFIDPNLKSEMYKSGMKQILQKPYMPEEVLRRIREVIDVGE